MEVGLENLGSFDSYCNGDLSRGLSDDLGNESHYVNPLCWFCDCIDFYGKLSPLRFF